MTKLNASTVSRKALLGGTALVAVAVTLTAVPGVGYAADLTASSNATWASSGGKTSADIANAKKEDNVELTGTSPITLTITNDNAANDGSANKNTFALGNVTDATTGAGKGSLKIVTGSTNKLSVGIKSINIKGDMTVENNNANRAEVNIVNRAKVAGTSLIKAANIANSNAYLNLKGASNTFTGAVTVQSGMGANASDAHLSLYGAATTFTGGVTLDDNGTTGDGHLNILGDVDQTVTGTVNGAAAGEGILNINNNGKTVTFTSAIGGTQKLDEVNVGIDASEHNISNTKGANAIFEADVAARSIKINAGSGGNGHSRATFKGNVTAGTSLIKAANITNSNAYLNLKGASNTFTGAVTVQSGMGANTSDAHLSLYGAATTFTGGVTLDDNGTTGDGHLNILGDVDQTVTGTVNGAAAGEGILNINNNGKTVTFTSAIGGTQKLDEVNVGIDASEHNISNTKGANAIFEADVAARSIKINAGSGGNGHSRATFKGNVTAGTSLIKAANITNSNAYLNLKGASNTFTGAVTVQSGMGANTSDAHLSLYGAATTFTGGVTLDDNGTTGDGHLNILGDVDQTVTGTVNGAAAGEGILNINNNGKTVTFTSAIGGTQKLDEVNVGIDASEHNISNTKGANAIFEADVAARSIKINAGSGGNGHSRATFKGNVTAGTSLIKAANIANSNAYLNLKGASNTFTGAVTVQSGMGANTSDAHLSLYGAATTFTGGVTLDDNGTTGDGHLNILGDVDQTVTGTINGAAAGEGILNINNNGKTVTFTSAIGGTQKLDEVNVGIDASEHNISNTKGANAVFSDTVNTKTLTSGGMLTFNKAGSSVGADLNLKAGTKIALGSGITNGQNVLNLAAQTSDLKGKKFIVYVPSSLGNGQSINLIKGGANSVGSALDNDSFKLRDTGLFTYKGEKTGNNYKITANKRSTAGIASALGVSTSAALSIDNANTALSGDKDKEAFAALNKVLQAGGAEAKKAAQQLGVQTDTLGAGSSAAVGTGAQVVGVASDRLAALRTGVQYAGVEQDGFVTGFASGDHALSNAFWLKPFGNRAKQNDKGGVAGYSANTGGIALGIDAEATDGVRIGASFAYSSTDVTGKGAGRSKTDVKSYQWTAYADYTADDFYVEGMLGFAANSNKTSRQLTFGGLKRTAGASYDSTQYMASVGGGMPIQVKTGVFVTPAAGLSYTRVSADSYTETGAKNLNMKVAPDDVDVFLASAGVRAHTRIKQGNGAFVPSARAGLSYDLAGNKATATGSYTGGGAAFKVEGAKAEKLAGNLGLGLTYESGPWSLGANYDTQFKSGFTGHSASLEARIKF